MAENCLVVSVYSLLGSIYSLNTNFYFAIPVVKIISLSLSKFQVLVLSRIVPYSINNLPPVYMQNSPKVNAYFASSNIYSDPERILLSWMNTNYENARHVIWKNCQKGEIFFFFFALMIKDCILRIWKEP